MPILKGALYYRAALLARCGSFAVRMRVLVIEFVDGFRYVPINIAVRHLKVTFRRTAHSVEVEKCTSWARETLEGPGIIFSLVPIVTR